MRLWIRLPATALALAANLTAGTICGWAADPAALWKIVHERCLPHFLSDQDPAPCAALDLSGGEAGGTAVLKDINGNTQFLLIPTRRLSGIEDEALGADDLPNYWQAAFDAAHFVAERAGRPLPPDAVSLSINGADWRSQDQLHIHIDCIRPDIRAAIAANSAAISTEWLDFPGGLSGQSYRVRRIAGPRLQPDPFRLVKQEIGAAKQEMRDETLLVTGAPGVGGGFILLARNAAKGERAHAEDLQDHDCSLAR